MGVLCLVACLAATAAGADFINGGFEDGTFGGWTQDGGYWYGSIGTYTYSGDPGTSAIVGVGNDPLLAEMSVNVPMVYSGNYAARVNDYGGGNHFSTISQATVWTRPHMYFAWSAVLQEPGHVHDEEPHFLISLHDDTADVDLYSILIASDTTPEIFQMVNDWKYSGWQVVDLDIEAAGAVGHTLTLTLLASDCAQGGHGGYVYLDGFGAAPPQTLTPRELKRQVVLNLTTAFFHEGRWTDNRISQAIRAVRDSLVDKRWVDDNHLTDSGEWVFSREREAIEHLVQVLKSLPPESDIAGILQGAENDLVNADDALALTAIQEAGGSGGQAKSMIPMAQQHYTSGVAAHNAGACCDAVLEFRLAWKFARKAARHPAP